MCNISEISSIIFSASPDRFSRHINLEFEYSTITMTKIQVQVQFSL